MQTFLWPTVGDQTGPYFLPSFYFCAPTALALLSAGIASSDGDSSREVG